MISNRSLLEHVLVAFREGDMDECIRLVRTLVDAAPLATAPRQLLASIFAQTGRGRLAVGHYRKLLTAAVARGEVVRAIAFQKQIDAFQAPEAHVPDRWAMLQRQLRAHDLSFLFVVPSSNGRPWTEAELLTLPQGWFERLAAETRFEYFGIDPRTIEAETGTVWEVLAGRLRWSFALSDGRASIEELAVEGEAIHVDPDLARRARLTLIPELPAETLRFDAGLVRHMKAALADAATSGPAAQGRAGGTRAPLPTRLPRWGDPRPVAPDKGDGGDLLKFRVLSLGEDSSPSTAAPFADAPAPTLSDASSAQSVPHAQEAEATAPSEGRERESTEVPVSDALGQEDLGSSRSEESAAPSSIPGHERRRHPRVAVSLESRLALLGLTDSPLTPIRGLLADLSTSGLSVRFTTRELGPSRGALADAVVAVDLELPGPAGAMRVAAQVHWLEMDEQTGEARLGIEFVLLTEPDRRRISGALARAALAAHAASQKAA